MEGTDADVDEQQDAGLRDELRLVDEELAEARRSADELRERIGDRADFPTDAAEQALVVSEAQDQDSLIANLEARRTELLGRLGD